VPRTRFVVQSRPGSFPAPRVFLLPGAKGEIHDVDLFPAVSQAVRGCPRLEALSISHRGSPWGPTDFGYSVTTCQWGVPPPLMRLHTQPMGVPTELTSGWFILRGAINLRVIDWDILGATTVNRTVGTVHLCDTHRYAGLSNC
jgi:hypothetical protein